MSDRIVSAKSARRTAKLFNYGNLITIGICGIPLFFAHGTTGVGTILMTALAIIPLVLWFGGSMLFYAFNRHHPNPKVGYYTQHAAYRYYAVMGSLIVIATFFPSEIRYYLIFWVITMVILIPLTLRDFAKIRKDDWQDTVIPDSDEEFNHE